MSGVFTDPDKLEAFSNALKGYDSFVRQRLSAVQMRLSQLGDTWRDQEYRRFADDFRKTQAQLAELSRVLEEIAPQLKADAERARAIHRPGGWGDYIMASVIVDPDQLRIFANRLLNEVRALKDQMSAIERQRDILEEVWRDERYRHFEATYVPSLKTLERFCVDAERYAASMKAKAEKADRFLKGR
jgi:uncharacterized protein YukE